MFLTVIRPDHINLLGFGTLTIFGEEKLLGSSLYTIALNVVFFSSQCFLSRGIPQSLFSLQSERGKEKVVHVLY